MNPSRAVDVYGLVRRRLLWSRHLHGDDECGDDGDGDVRSDLDLERRREQRQRGRVKWRATVGKSGIGLRRRTKRRGIELSVRNQPSWRRIIGSTPLWRTTGEPRDDLPVVPSANRLLTHAATRRLIACSRVFLGDSAGPSDARRRWMTT